MVFYEFYLRNEVEGDKLIGILPERRNKSDRVDLESIMKWSKVVFGESLETDSIYFIIVTFSDTSEKDKFTREEIMTIPQSFIAKPEEAN